MTIKLYTTEYAAKLPSLFEKRSAYLRAFGGTIQTIVGAEAQEEFLKVKVTDTDTVIQAYSTDADVAFGNGTGNTNRFGPRRENKSINVSVNFDAPLSIHEGVDFYTVNDVPDEIVAEILVKNTAAMLDHYDNVMGKKLSDSADKTLSVEPTEASVIKAFNDARKTLVNNKVSKANVWLAYVTPDVYSILVDSNLAKASKNSTVNMDAGEVYNFKGFEIIELDEGKFQKDEVIYFTSENVGLAGVGIPVARAIDSEDFAGISVQAAGKFGKYIPEKNKKAIVKAVLVADETPEA